MNKPSKESKLTKSNTEGQANDIDSEELGENTCQLGILCSNKSYS